MVVLIIKNRNINCFDCGRQFIENPQKVRIGDDKKTLIARLLLEKISLAGIAGSVSVSPTWLPGYVNQKYAQITSQLKVSVKKKEN